MPHIEASNSAVAVVAKHEDGRLSMKFHCPKCGIGNIITHNSTVTLNPRGTFITCNVCNHQFRLDIRYKDAEVKPI